MTNMRKIAEYYRHRCAVMCIPVRADGSKAPAVGGWKRYQRPGADVDLSLFDRNVGIAILGGRVSGGLVVMDFDKEGLFEDFAALVPGDLLQRIPHVRTPSLGDHLYFRVRGIVIGNLKLARGQSAATASGVKTLIETRGEAGYVLAPGCPASCHPAGRRYQHVGGPVLANMPTMDVETKEILFTAARAFHTAGPIDSPPEAPARPQHRVRPIRPLGLAPWDDFNYRVDWTSILTPKGWTPVGHCGGRILWRRPTAGGKGQPSRVSAKSGERDASGVPLLVVYSNNADPFSGVTPSGHCGMLYSPFQAFTLLYHGGDAKAAARDLRHKGYGNQRRASRVKRV